MNATPNPDLVVLDLSKVPRWLVYDVETLHYDGILSADVLSHLADCAREREASYALKLAALGLVPA